MLTVLVLVLSLLSPLNTYAVVGDNVGNSSLDMRVGQYNDTSSSQTLFGMLKQILDKLAALDTMSQQMSTMSDQINTIANKVNSLSVNSTPTISSYLLTYSFSSNNTDICCKVTYVSPDGVSHTTGNVSGQVSVKRGSTINVSIYTPRGMITLPGQGGWSSVFYNNTYTGLSSNTPVESKTITTTSDKSINVNITCERYSGDLWVESSIVVS